MSIQNPKQHEIKRLTTPLTIKDSKVYDEGGKLLNCVETLSDVRFINEPMEGILSEDEVLQYAPESRAASQIRLSRGFGDNSDVLLIHNSLPWILGFYYVVILCVSIPVLAGGNKILLFAILILVIIPLVYMYYIFNLKRYKLDTTKKVKKTTQNKVKTDAIPVVENTGFESLKEYEKEINNLKVIFKVKEDVVKDLIEKRFEPPQITYDKFISVVNSAEKLFNSQAESALNIINLAVEDNSRVREEIENKIDAMKRIISQIEDLTNELVINISSDEQSDDDVKNLIDDMENIISSVKEY